MMLLMPAFIVLEPSVKMTLCHMSSDWSGWFDVSVGPVAEGKDWFDSDFALRLPSSTLLCRLRPVCP